LAGVLNSKVSHEFAVGYCAYPARLSKKELQIQLRPFLLGSTMHYYQFNIGDYRRDTFHLTLLEHGVYRQLLDTYYLNETPLCVDTAVVMRTHTARTKDEKAAVLMVLENFFLLTDDGWVHNGCEKNISKYKEKSDKARVSADVRWSKRNANAMPTQCESDANHKLINHKPLTNIKDIEAKASKAKSTRLPSDWELPDEWAIWCIENRKDLNPNQVAEQFKDYWLSVPNSKGLKADWLATWRNWCRNQKASTNQISFAERDAMNRRKRWEEMTGQQWTDDHQTIDTSPIFLGIEQ
jgi:uncharacterized protein YdaU (DUF1376 family)